MTRHFRLTAMIFCTAILLTAGCSEPPPTPDRLVEYQSWVRDRVLEVAHSQEPPRVFLGDVKLPSFTGAESYAAIDDQDVAKVPAREELILSGSFHLPDLVLARIQEAQALGEEYIAQQREQAGLSPNDPMVTKLDSIRKQASRELLLEIHVIPTIAAYERSKERLQADDAKPYSLNASHFTIGVLDNDGKITLEPHTIPPHPVPEEFILRLMIAKPPSRDDVFESSDLVYCVLQTKLMFQ